jgi:predicted nucleotidyltransferase
MRPFSDRWRAARNGRTAIDIFVELAPEAPIGVYEYVNIVQFIEGLFAGRVEVVERESLKRAIRPFAERDAAYAF